MTPLKIKPSIVIVDTRSDTTVRWDILPSNGSDSVIDVKACKLLGSVAWLVVGCLVSLGYVCGAAAVTVDA